MKARFSIKSLNEFEEKVLTTELLSLDFNTQLTLAYVEFFGDYNILLKDVDGISLLFDCAGLV